MSFDAFSEKKLGGLIRSTLLTGLTVCGLFLLLGFALLALGSPYSGKIFTLGILALLLTPALRVTMLAYGFLRLGQSFFAVSALAVLAQLLAAFIL
jgi:hypothetical protein